ncbi:hypothetical protein M8998_04425 [Sphingobacterium sp. lm-10]|uniref:hypothetical protein n=1 Tax=Sphingobacterium sp. lm-10 TaxID=2944904 RepID=UPI00201FF80B|nr:hypothetical protein [Sphingobacterium sp. lm-10]MCL7987184.1 hypothetical protein [Sphingobacterium sp. lm-10]
MKKEHRKFSPVFKTKVVLEAFKEVSTMQSLLNQSIMKIVDRLVEFYNTEKRHQCMERQIKSASDKSLNIFFYSTMKIFIT